ncbi:MAG: cation-translocating P-type ATPase [Promethearchaeota archaeon]
MSEKAPSVDASVADELFEGKFANNFSPDEIITILGSDRDKGLSSEEAANRLIKYGVNELPKVKTSFWKIYIAPISNWLINIYLIAAMAIFLLALSLGPEDLGPVIPLVVPWFIVIGANCIVAVVQQFRGQKKLEALQKLMADDIPTIRDGKQLTVLTSKLVPGDVILLRQGERVPADCMIIDSANLEIDESSLTGESVPVEKNVAPDGLEGELPIQETTNMVFLGSYVAQGIAKVIVVFTGVNTVIGELSRELEEITTGEIPIRKKVNVLAKYLGIAVGILLAISVSFRILSLFIFPPPGVQAKGVIEWVDLAPVLINGLVVALAIMPINIVLLVTIVLITGVLAMAKENVIIRDLSAVETLGRVSVVCSDKTGTMTENKMTVKRVWDGDGSLYGVTGSGLKKEGVIFKIAAKATVDLPRDKALQRPVDSLTKSLEYLLINGILNNDARISEGQLIGTPTDGAIRVLFYKSQLQEDKILQDHELVAEFPFDSRVKRMSKVFNGTHTHAVFCKGASEVILPRCSRILRGNNEENFTEQDKEKVLAHVNEFAQLGFRVISFAHKSIETLPNDVKESRNEIESNMTYDGFVCIVDPPRPGVYEAIKDCQSAGVQVTMITGDSSVTGSAIAKELNIIEEDSDQISVEGYQIKSLTEERFFKARVFARVSPEDKQIIVNRYQKGNRVVAMTGDGVNDALALSMSDAGIAMGIAGTDVAKQASDILITDDSFVSIKTGIKEGRNLFQKIRMMCYFYVCINLMEAAILFGMSFIPNFFGFLTFQLQWLYVSAHTFPGFALVFDKGTSNIMQEKPRDTQEIIDRKLFKIMALHAALMAIGVAFIYFVTFTGLYPVFAGNLSGIVSTEWSLAQQKARTMAIVTIVFVESLMVLSIRRINMPITKSNKGEDFSLRTYIFIALVIVGTVGLIYVPAVQLMVIGIGIVFEFMWLTWLDWVLIIIACLPSVAGIEFYKWNKRRNGITF